MSKLMKELEVREASKVAEGPFMWKVNRTGPRELDCGDEPRQRTDRPVTVTKMLT